MMKLQEDDVMDNMIVSVDDIFTPAFQSDAVSGINDSSYNAFPTPPAYNEAFPKSTNPVYETPQEVISVIDGEEPTYPKSTNPVYEPQPVPVFQEPVREEPTYPKSTNPVYEPQPIAVVQEPVREEPATSIKCMRVMFTANRGFSATAYWKDCSGVQKSKFVSVNETLEVDALEGTASGLPFMSYPIGQSPVYEATPIVKSTNPVVDFPVESGLLSPEIYTPAQAPTPDVVSPVDQIFAPPVVEQGTPEVPVTQVPAQPVYTATPTPETTLPIKTSKDLKPYIIAGIAVVGLLIASRLFSKK